MANPPQDFECFLVRKTGESIASGVDRRPLRELPAGDVLIRVQWSSLNYKDALAATGHSGIVRRFPHVPGIDAAGIVAESSSPLYRAGDEVLSTGHELGVERWGGWAEYVRVPAEWVIPRPQGLTLEETMMLGTAGFTAAQCVAALAERNIVPESGPVVVTGATGGVGTIALKLLSKLGYEVAAVTGKPGERDWLLRQGAAETLTREEFLDTTTRPLLATRWAGGVDAVGGAALTTLVRSLKQRGCVAACGVAGGADLPLTVYPFILRGVALQGIDSAWCPEDRRREIWRRLSEEWRLDGLSELATTIRLADVPGSVREILEGRVRGRRVVRIQPG
ncbi:MAG: YhdH/YhfP family quinone oxidoreductase [Planctomyces sp.]|nr:YhdH/YhfP family quinone oxidoreductase [Planctomyces sp.]